MLRKGIANVRNIRLLIVARGTVEKLLFLPPGVILSVEANTFVEFITENVESKMEKSGVHNGV